MTLTSDPVTKTSRVFPWLTSITMSSLNALIIIVQDKLNKDRINLHDRPRDLDLILILGSSIIKTLGQIGLEILSGNGFWI